MKNKQSDKKPQTEKARGKYDERLAVAGSFFDVLKASTKDANDKTDKKKKEKNG